MRRVLVAVLAVSLAVVAGAGGARAQGGPPGVLQIAVISDATLNPFTLPQQLPTLMVSKVIFGTLTRYQPGDGKPVGDLAASWKTTDDGRTWEFKLRPGVKWHDGKPFTAADVKFTLENIVNPQVKALFRSQLQGLQRVETPDDLTARLVFKRGNQIPSGDYDARTSWRITSADPDKTAEYTTVGVNNHYAYSNPEVDALMAKARSTIDEGARVATFRKLQELIYRDAPLVWIYHQPEILAMSKRVKGYPDLGVRDALPWAHQIAVP